MAWFTNGTKIDTRLNGLRDKIHLLEDRIVYLEDRIHKFSNAIYLLQEDIKQSKLTKPKDDVISDRFVESARNTVPITPSRYDESNIMIDANPMPTVVINPYSKNSDISSSHSVWTTSYDCDFVSTSSDSSSCSFD